jgi:hypothetical protein
MRSKQTVTRVALRGAALAAVATLISPLPVSAEEADSPTPVAPIPTAGPFAAGRTRVAIMVGGGSSAFDDYLILGAGVGYFIVDGLEIGLDYEAWIAGDPVMNRLSPETRYVFHMVPAIKPYVGAFYRHTFVTDDIEDFDQLGGRVGAYLVPRGGRLYAGGGAVYERLLDCSSGALVDCDTVYPEIFIGFSL